MTVTYRESSDMLSNLKALVRHRALVQSLVARELKARYRGSVLGFFWSFINPLLLLLIYSFVFTYVIAARADIKPYALFMFCGILPWTWFSSSLLESSNVLIAGGNLIKKVLFPAEILPIVSVLANMVHFFLGLPILVFFILYYHWAPGATLELPYLSDLVWFPMTVLVQLILTLALSLLVAALTVHFRDIKDILSNLLTFWFFATPIIYPMDQIEPQYKWLFDLNPFTHIAITYQEILFFPGPVGHWKWLVALGFASTVLLAVAYFLFNRLRDTFAEEV